jgi:hypothetical protein
VTVGDAQPGLALRATDRPLELNVDLDLAGDGRWSERMPSSLQVQWPSGKIDTLPLAASAPGRASGVIREPAAGLYRFTAMTASGSQTLAHLRQSLRERDVAGPNPQLQAWRSARLFQDWSPAALSQAVAAAPAPSMDMRRALLLALLLFVCAILLDRWPRWRGGNPVPVVVAWLSRGRSQRPGAPGP